MLGRRPREQAQARPAMDAESGIAAAGSAATREKSLFPMTSLTARQPARLPLPGILIGRTEF